MSQFSTRLRSFQIHRTRSRAKKLVANKQSREAIDFLQRKNRNLQSPKIENQLAQLRHDAFFSIDHGTPRGVWPPVVTDLFPNSQIIPEVDASELDTDIARSGVFNHGSLIIRNLLSTKQIELLIYSTDKSFEAFDNAANLQKNQSWFTPLTSSHVDENLDGDRPFVREGGGVLAAESPQAIFHLINTLKETAIIDLVSEFLEERPALSVKKTTLRCVDPGQKAKNGWHQDGAFLGKGIRTLNVWIALSDCGVHAPSMDMIPRRLNEIVPTGTEGASFDWSISPKVVDQILEQGDLQHLIFKAGDAIIFDEMNLHRTSTTPEMSEKRYAVECWFFAPSCYPLDQLPILL
jgi:ectoine hydroxylase-related dioxygenase (phytanoyl-CoA dioxygenase family)